MASKQVFLSLGSNLGDRRQNLEKALAALERESVRVLKRSSFYETEPQDVTGQPWFLNLVVECETTYFPLQLLALLQRIERELGRVRSGAPPRGPRIIDIDILLFGKVKIKTATLEVPHPRMFDRRFVLEPLLEIAPELPWSGERGGLAAALQKASAQTVRKVQGEPA